MFVMWSPDPYPRFSDNVLALDTEGDRLNHIRQLSWVL